MFLKAFLTLSSELEQVGVPVVRKLEPDLARLRHQRMEDWIVVVTADKRLSVLEVDE